MADYKIVREDVKDASRLLQKKMKDLKTQIIVSLKSSDRDFERLQAAMDEYIKAYKTNDYLLGYAEIEEAHND